MRQLHQDQIDNDNCRVYFRDDEAALYCFQLESRGKFEFFECTTEGEPLARADLESFNFGNVAGEESLIRIAIEFNEWYDDNFAEYDVNPNLSY
jgi:hypothetical protein